MIAASNGYVSNDFKAQPGWPGPSAPVDAAINAPLDNGKDTFIRSQTFPISADYKGSNCVQACAEQAAYEYAHPSAGGARACQFVNSYLLLKNGVAQSQVCSMVRTSFPPFIPLHATGLLTSPVRSLLIVHSALERHYLRHQLRPDPGRRQVHHHLRPDLYQRHRRHGPVSGLLLHGQSPWLAGFSITTLPTQTRCGCHIPGRVKTVNKWMIFYIYIYIYIAYVFWIHDERERMI